MEDDRELEQAVSRRREARRQAALVAGGAGVLAALLVAVLWLFRSRVPVEESALASTTSLRVTMHDGFGMPSSPVAIRDPARVRTIVAALGVDQQPAIVCPPDYATADV